MQLGYSITSAISADLSPDHSATNVIERTDIVADAGYDYVQAGDHHAVAGAGYLQNIPMTARLASTIDKVVPLFLLPVWDPVYVAEQVGTLSTFADVDIWVAIGRDDQAEAMGIPAHERVPRLVEGLELIRELWDEDDVTYEGEFYSVENMSVNPKADPRIIMGGTAEPAVRRAGRLADGWVANAHVPVDEIADRVDWFNDTNDGPVLARRDILIRDDGDEARQLARTALEDGYRGWPVDANWLLIGDVDDVADQLRELQAAGVEEVVVRPMLDEYAEESLRGVATAREAL